MSGVVCVCVARVGYIADADGSPVAVMLRPRASGGGFILSVRCVVVMRAVMRLVDYRIRLFIH